ncbi:MAG TPA: hypothetical protein VH643_08430 [Gemmataceae bacterium]|jgi:hypothetical protein
MNRVILFIVSVVLVTQPVLAGVNTGVVVAVTEKGFTIRPDYVEKMTVDFGPDMGKRHNKFVPPGSPLGATSDQIKTGMKVQAWYRKTEDGSYECWLAKIIVEQIGPREIDFSSMLTKGNDTVSECTVRVYGYNKPKRGEQSVVINQGIVFKDGTSLKRIREGIKEMLAKNGWKVKESDDGKLVIEGAKDYPVLFMNAEAKGLPKDRQPKVRLLDPSK